MIRKSTILALAVLLAGCGKPGFDGTWTSSTGKDGFEMELRIAGNKIDIDFASHKTTAKMKASGTFTIKDEAIYTTIDKASIDESSLTGEMKKLASEPGVKKETEEVTKDLLSRQLSGPYKMEGATWKILGNPTDITLTRKP